jgi:hypothetical protein
MHRTRVVPRGRAPVLVAVVPLAVIIWASLSIVLHLFLATLPCDVLSGFLVFRSGSPTHVFVAPRHVTVSVLDDQQRAGA